MAVMEVNLPSGFTIDKDSLPALRRFKGVKRVDPAKGDTKVMEKITIHVKSIITTTENVI